MVQRVFRSQIRSYTSRSLGAALSRIGPARRRIRKQARGGQILQMPLGRAFGPPGPKDPARMLLIGVELRVDEMLQVVLVIGAQIRNRADGLAIAAADVARADVCQGAVIACAFSEAVEPFGAVGLGAGPFADDGPLVGAGELRAQGAGGGDVVGGTHADLTWGEDLVLMGIEEDVLVARGGLGHEAVPIGREVLECVMDAGCKVFAGSCHGLIAGLVEGLEVVEVEVGTKRFVEKLDCRDDVSVAGVALCEILKRGKCLADRITLLPINRSVAAAVVEAIL